MSTDRKIIEPIYLGEDEGINDYTLLIPTSWATTPTSPVVTIKNNYGEDVTSTCIDGAASVNGQYINLPMLTGRLYRVRHSLSAGGITAGPKYRLEVRFTSGGSDFEAWGDLYGEE